MNGGKLLKGDGRGGFSGRPVLRSALNARPTASQGEAPARATGKTNCRRNDKHRRRFWVRLTDPRRLTGATL